MNLHDAAKEGNLNALRQLINEGADPNAIDGLRWAPLHIAAAFGHTEIVSVLLENGADIDAGNLSLPAGFTPLHAAIFNERKDTALALIQAGANVNVTDDIGRAPLHMAAEFSHTEIALALMKKGANVSAIKHFGNAPSQVAMEHYGYTPLQIAIRKNNLATALAIIHYGKVPYAEIPVIENNPTSEYIQRQYQLATTQDSVSSYARGLFTGMNPSPRDTIMARIKIFVKGTEARDAYPITLKLLCNGRGLGPDLINVILEHAGLLPKNIDLNKLVIYPYRSARLFPAEATTSTSSHSSSTSVNAPHP